jgi:hypothetical protein
MSGYILNNLMEDEIELVRSLKETLIELDVSEKDDLSHFLSLFAYLVSKYPKDMLVKNLLHNIEELNRRVFVAECCARTSDSRARLIVELEKENYKLRAKIYSIKKCRSYKKV